MEMVRGLACWEVGGEGGRIGSDLHGHRFDELAERERAVDILMYMYEDNVNLFGLPWVIHTDRISRYKKLHLPPNYLPSAKAALASNTSSH
jgi:hypothetical protein